MKKATFLIMLLTILSNILGLLRDTTLSFYYGASNISDAYIISLTIPGAIFSFIGTAIATSYTPMYNQVSTIKDEGKAILFTNNLIQFVMIFCIIVNVFSLIFTENLVKLFASGFNESTLQLSISLTRISTFGIYFNSLVYIFSAYLRIKNNFIIPASIGIPLNLVTIFFIVMSTKHSLMLLAVGTVIAAAVQVLLLIPFVYNQGYSHRWVLNLKDEHTNKMLRLSFPVILGTSVIQINKLVDRTMASLTAEGGISALNYAYRVDGIIQGIFVMSFVTVMYPMISRLAAEKNLNGLKKTVSETIGLVNILVIPCTAGVLLFARPIIQIVFGRGGFDSDALTMTSDALFFYSIGMIGFGLREVIAQTFYALHDTKTPMINAALALLMNIVLNIILSRFLGIGGLALATSISAIFCTILLFISLYRKIGSLNLKRNLISLLKIIAATSIMSLLSKITYEFVLNYINPTFSLGVTVVIGVIIYFTLIYFMRVDELNNLVQTLRSRLKKNITDL